MLIKPYWFVSPDSDWEFNLREVKAIKDEPDIHRVYVWLTGSIENDNAIMLEGGARELFISLFHSSRIKDEMEG